jgi:Tat protein secretion system quality control protein TatD with DNase activity
MANNDTHPSKRKNPTCLCCAILPEDLFLPSTNIPSLATEHTSEPESQVLNPSDAWMALHPTHADSHDIPLILVDTHGHAHLERNTDDDVDFYQLPMQSEIDSKQVHLVSLTCAVHPDDWDACIAYAQASPYHIAAVGIHPWYLNDLPPHWLERLEGILQNHPRIAVGEIGLCKMARWVRTYPAGKQVALEWQRQVFVQQLHLAARYQRLVSVHCVNQQSILLQTLQECEHLPPAIALHSFSGTAHQIQQLLKWEHSLSETKSTTLYFGFSYAVNYAMSTSDKSRRQGREAVKAVPFDRLLAESDLHCTEAAMGGTVATLAFLAWALDEPIRVVAARVRENSLRFFQALYNVPCSE